MVLFERAILKHIFLDEDFLHEFVPSSIDAFKLCIIFRSLLSDVFRGEYVLQVQPITLKLTPLLNSIRHNNELFLQFLDFVD
jgi:hypothetical protein